jgi:hypothetical protein
MRALSSPFASAFILPAAQSMSAPTKKLRVGLRKIGTAKESAAILDPTASGAECWAQLLKLSQNKLKLKAQRFFVAQSGLELSVANCVSELWGAGDGVVVVVSKGEQYETHETKPAANQKSADAKSATASAAAPASGSASASASADSTKAAADGKQQTVAADTTKKPESAVAVHSSKSKAAVRVLCAASWLDELAVSQLKATASAFSDCVLAVGMPDLHPGPTYPIGAFVSPALCVACRVLWICVRKRKE